MIRMLIIMIIIASVFATFYSKIKNEMLLSLCIDWMFKSVQCSINKPVRYCKYNIL